MKNNSRKPTHVQAKSGNSLHRVHGCGALAAGFLVEYLDSEVIIETQECSRQLCTHRRTMSS